jgi:imidazolonepropionase-like amidohydrolase
VKVGVFSVDACWHGGWRGPATLVATGAGIRLATPDDPAPTMHLPGAVLPGFVDAHAHVGLIDATALRAGGIAAVDDLGWDPEIARTWLDDPELPTVRFAGAFITAPGGYPSDREWAPDAAVETVTDAAGARVAVDRQLQAGATFIKVALNADAGPVLDDETLRAVVGHSHVRGREVVAHVEGVGQAARAFEAGVDRLAHAPWSERLPDELLAAMAGPKARTLSGVQSWVSTLDIHGWGEFTHEFVTARDNLRRFHAFGGAIVYGTDLGNGPLPTGVNERELRALIAAGISEVGIVRAMTPPHFGTALSYLPGTQDDDICAWLASASVITADQLASPQLMPSAIQEAIR